MLVDGIRPTRKRVYEVVAHCPGILLVRGGRHPSGILMSSFRWLFELINPVAAPMRAMPLTAFLPAFIACVA